MSALRELELAVAELAKVGAELDSALLETRIVGHDERMHFGTLLHTVATVCTRAIPDAVRAQVRRDAEVALASRHLLGQVVTVDAGTARREESAASDKTDSPDALVMAFRSAIYEVRALQDALYRIAYAVATGHAPKRGQTALSITKNEDLVRVLLGEHSEEYSSWLIGWRVLRDGVKRGRGLSIVGPGSPAAAPDDYGLSLTDTSIGGGVVVDCSRGTRVSDISRAIRLTQTVIELIAAEARYGNA